MSKTSCAARGPGARRRLRAPGRPRVGLPPLGLTALLLLGPGCIIDNTPPPEESPEVNDDGGEGGEPGESRAGSAGDDAPAAGAGGAAGANASGGADPSCNDTCTYANDGACDEPYLCTDGTDCTDCADAPDMVGIGDTPDTCENSCDFARDGYCDEPFLCTPGTDCEDCGYGPATGSGGAGGEGGAEGSGGTPAVGTGGSEPAVDPCGDVPVTGECVSAGLLRACAVPTNDALPSIVESECPLGTTCSTASGRATCTPLPSGCTPGAATCADDRTLSECDSTGTPRYTDCGNGCRDTALGAFCVSNRATRVYEGVLRYEARSVNASYTDFGAPRALPAAGLLLMAKAGEELVDAVTTAEDGAFSINIPDPPDTAEPIVVALFQPDAAKTGPGVAVALPDVGDGEQSIYAVDGMLATIWSFSIDPTATPSGSTVTVTEDAGSGAIRVFSNLRSAYLRAASDFTGEPRSLVAWFRMNTAWSCGACFSSLGDYVGDQVFDSQIWIPAVAEDQSYWSDAVTLHEIGHWAMATFGVSPGEGGRHCLGTPTYPGQAWSEGWATAYSAILRDEPRFYDKQEGTFFWSDVGAREFSGGYPWKRPVPSGGVYQKMIEDEISAMLWDLNAELGAPALFAALESPRMTTAPYGRGYTRTVWEPGGTYGCDQVNVSVTATPTPMFADFLDALVCAGATASVIDGVTSPDTHYPYDAPRPLCD